MGQVAPSPRGLSAYEARGRITALWRWGACHGIDAGQVSATPWAPTFAVLSERMDPIALEKALTGVRRDGHADMPPRDPEIDEALAIAAFIESFAPPAVPGSR